MKMWDGRFSLEADSLMEQINNSLSIDQRMIDVDVAGSIAWAKALKKAGVYSSEELALVEKGLKEILQEYAEGTITFLQSDEDIHMAVERLLVEKIGDAGAKLHTGRSRNDQVATDFRLFIKGAIEQIKSGICELQNTLLERAKQDQKIIIPGYTHLQQAQPILLAHYWLSFFFLLEREKARVTNAVQSVDHMPLGSGALAGSGFPIDRELLRKELGFAHTGGNSLDGVASRDFALETLSVISSIGIHLSRYAEDLIIWSSREFGFVELSDAWSSGSSMMPQKKNPDSLELIRGKSGRFIGNYTRFAATLKGVGLTYYKDLQEDKEPVFDSVDQILMVLEVFKNVISTLTINEQGIKKQLDPFLLATDIADYLVIKKVPFRHAHKIVGQIVAYCIEHKKDLTSLSLEELQSFSDVIDNSVMSIFNWETGVAHRDLPGGTGPESVKKQIHDAEKLLK